jgi:polyisoprenoid-binding protein YceI
MRPGRDAIAIAALLLCPLTAGAEPLVLRLLPDRTSVTFTVSATGHAIEGAIALADGEVRFDTDTGAAAGEVTIDLRRAGTGNRLRDHEMHSSVLESERYPVATFRPSRVVGTFVRSGPCELMLAGILGFHGVDHSLTLPIRVVVTGDTVVATTAVDVPYVAWGLRNPSLLFLRVAPIAAVSLRTEGTLLQRSAVSR